MPVQRKAPRRRQPLRAQNFLTTVTTIVHPQQPERNPPCDATRDARVYNFARAAATKNGKFSISIWAAVLCWPHSTRNSPGYWRDYVDQSGRHMTLEAASVTYQVLTAMQADGADYVAFLSYKTLATRSRVSVRTVAKVMSHIKDSPAPLFFFIKPGITRGVRHGCYRFVAIMDPLAFAKARDEQRDVEQAHFRAREDERKYEALRAQADHMTDKISEAEMTATIQAIHDSTRGKLPRKAAKQMSRFRYSLGKTA